MKDIARKAEETPEVFREAPYFSKVSRPDEALAARSPKLRWKPKQ